MTSFYSNDPYQTDFETMLGHYTAPAPVFVNPFAATGPPQTGGGSTRDIIAGAVAEIFGGLFGSPIPLSGPLGGVFPQQIPPPPTNGNGRSMPPVDIPIGPNRPGVPYGRNSPRGYWNKQGRWINRKRPSMNVLNPRALRRAMRRVEGFAGFAKRTISFTKRVKMKKKGRR